MKGCNHRYKRNVQKDYSLAAILDFQKLSNFDWKTFPSSGTIHRMILIFGMIIAPYMGMLHVPSEFIKIPRWPTYGNFC